MRSPEEEMLPLMRHPPDSCGSAVGAGDAVVARGATTGAPTVAGTGRDAESLLVGTALAAAADGPVSEARAGRVIPAEGAEVCALGFRAFSGVGAPQPPKATPPATRRANTLAQYRFMD